MSVYLDYNATTPIDKTVRKIIYETLAKNWGNPSSSNDLGRDAAAVISEARQKVGRMIHCHPDEIIFTSGGTESNHMVIHTAIKAFHSDRRSNGSNNNVEPKPHIITTNIEHDSVKLLLEYLAANGEIDVTFVPISTVTKAFVVNDIINAIQPNTCLITVMLANNETGVLQPVEFLTRKLRDIKNTLSHKIYVHSDAAQAIGKMNVFMDDLRVDYLTIVGHKFYGPRIGAVYFKQGNPLHPIFYGGGQEKNLRPGTENTCMIAGLGMAAELVTMNVSIYIRTMRDTKSYLKESLKKEFADKVIFHFEHLCDLIDLLPNTLSVAFNFENITGRDILKEAKTVLASTGAACHSDDVASSVLLAYGVPPDLACKTLRLSVGRETSKQDVDIAVQRLKMAIEKLMAKI